LNKLLITFLLVFFDLLAIYISIFISFYIKSYLDPYFTSSTAGDLTYYVGNSIFYIVAITTLFSNGIYNYRHDFWEESYIVLKSLFFALILLLSIFALSKTIGGYSRVVIVLSFVIMAFLIPIFKFILKKKLALFGLWNKYAQVISLNSNIVDSIFINKYLGYIKATNNNAEIIFMDTAGMKREDVEVKLLKLSHEKKEIIFIPMLNNFNFSNSKIIEIFNARANMIVLNNSLLNKKNIILKKLIDIILSIILVPILIPIFALIIYKIKKYEPNGSIFFKQIRMGENGKEFVCYKFRSMLEDSDEVLSDYLKLHPEEIKNYEKYHKYIKDPRISKVGNFLRKTSLDELPQIINVFKGEMSLIGPRPYMIIEKEKIASKLDMVLAVKPGITGLWQVSGRNDVDFNSRVDMDVYYTRNWTLWLDFVILIKTIKTLFIREGVR